jgi:hypothetical protein
MATYYSFQKGKYGGAVGTIYPFPRTLSGDSPTDTDWVRYVPAGYLRCDGSILKADEYRSLANVIGVGSDCIYKKSNIQLDEPLENGFGGQIQLPDFGSKYVTAFSSNTGIILDNTAPNPNTPGTFQEKVGVGVDLTLNQGEQITFNYSGNFSVPQTDIPISGNYILSMGGQSATGTIAEEQILTHGHYSNAARLKLATAPNKKVATFAPGPNLAGDLYTGAGGWDTIEFEDIPVQSSGSISSTQHEHGIKRTNPTHTASAYIESFQIDASPVTTTVQLASEDTTAFNDISQKFILVEYLIKF